MRELAPGTEIGGAYLIEAPISTGGMGAVHRARRLSDDLEVAIKQPLLERDALRFRIEARLLSRLRHPRVVRVLDRVADEHGDFLVMELVRGPSLAAVLEEGGPLPVADALRDRARGRRRASDQGVPRPSAEPAVLETTVRAAAGVFGAAAPRRSPAAARTRASPARSPLAPATCPTPMLVLPLGPSERPFGVRQILDRLDGEALGPGDTIVAP